MVWDSLPPSPEPEALIFSVCFRPGPCLRRRCQVHGREGWVPSLGVGKNGFPFTIIRIANLIVTRLIATILVALFIASITISTVFPIIDSRWR